MQHNARILEKNEQVSILKSQIEREEQTKKEAENNENFQKQILLARHGPVLISKA